MRNEEFQREKCFSFSVFVFHTPRNPSTPRDRAPGRGRAHSQTGAQRVSVKHRGCSEPTLHRFFLKLNLFTPSRWVHVYSDMLLSCGFYLLPAPLLCRCSGVEKCFLHAGSQILDAERCCSGNSILRGKKALRECTTSSSFLPFSLLLAQLLLIFYIFSVLTSVIMAAFGVILSDFEAFLCCWRQHLLYKKTHTFDLCGFCSSNRWEM